MRSNFSPATLRTVIDLVAARPPALAMSTACSAVAGIGSFERYRHQSLRLLSSEAGVLEAHPFRFGLIEADPIVDAHRLRGILVGALLRVDAVVGVPHRIDRLGHLARKHALGRRGRIVLGPLGCGELVAAVRADGIAGGDERQTLGAFLRRRCRRLRTAVVRFF